MRKTKLNNKYLLILAPLALFAAGCGVNPTGNYVGTETIQASYQQSGSNTNPASLILSTGGSNSVTGQYSSTTGTGQFTATMSSDGTQLQNVNLNIPTVTGGYSTCSGTFTGILALSSSTIQGTLTVSAGTNYNYVCTGRNMTLTKQQH